MREDIQIALDRFEINTFGNKKGLARAEELLRPDETILFASPSNVVITYANTKKQQKMPGIVFLSDQRFLFSYKMLSSFSVESISLSEIQSVDCTGSPGGSFIGIHTLTKSFSVMVTYKMEIAQKILECFEEARKSVALSSSDEVPAPSISTADEILKYKNLLDCGAITEAEYEAKKKQLLNL